MVSLKDAPRPVGRSSLSVPAMGLGLAHLGELYATVPEAASRDTIRAGWDGGVRFYDTAPWYGRGLSELRAGAVLRSVPRDELILSTKVGRTLRRPADRASFTRAPWTGGLNNEVVWSYTGDGVHASIEQSMQRLGLDRLDALVIHDLDRAHHDEGAMAAHRADLEATGLPALHALRASGEIGAVGMGINTAEALDAFADTLDVDFFLVAMPYTLLDQSTLANGMATCARRGISVVVGAPFASGILATGSAGGGSYGYAAAPPEIRTKVRDIEAVCAAHGVALPAAALQFPLAHPAVASVIPGAAGAAEVRANVAAFEAGIPDAFWSDLRDRGLVRSDAPVPAPAPDRAR